MQSAGNASLSEHTFRLPSRSSPSREGTRRTHCHESYVWKGRGAECLPVPWTRQAYPGDVTAGLRWRMSSTDQLRARVQGNS